MENEKLWGTAGEAIKFYNISAQTLHNWRRGNKIETRKMENTNRNVYEYYLDPEIKKSIEILRKLDNRWA